jgi:hypothetical protein
VRSTIKTAGGKQIRMAHPMLAKSVLEYVLQIKKKTLSALTVDMLKSNLIKSTSRGRDDVFEIVHLETALSVYFHMYVKNNNGYLYRLIQEIV